MLGFDSWQLLACISPHATKQAFILESRNAASKNIKSLQYPKFHPYRCEKDVGMRLCISNFTPMLFAYFTLVSVLFYEVNFSSLTEQHWSAETSAKQDA